MTFDPDAAARPGEAVFGLPHTFEDASVVLIPVPFDATTSYRPGTADGPEAIRRASAQVDLFDRALGRVYERGIFMEPSPGQIRELSRRTRELTEPIIARGGAGEADAEAVRRIDAAGDQVNRHVHAAAARVLAAGKTQGVVGGEHSVSFGAIRACAEHFGQFGILQIDAHLDLRAGFEGFRWSHASIMHNVLEQVPGVSRVVQVGIRDMGEGELAAAGEYGDRVVTFFDEEMFTERARGATLAAQLRRVVDALPGRVYITFDIDGLDPSLCPHTGTPVPGGLTFQQAAYLLHLVAESGRRVVGFDLVEVAPGPEGGPEWDANVGARILYKLCGLAQAV